MDSPLTHHDDDRPSKFANLIGNPRPIRRILTMIERNRLSNVILINGPPGAGKTTLARVIARRILCEDPPSDTSEPCGHCGSCRRRFDERGFNLGFHERDCGKIDSQSDLDGMLDWDRGHGSTVIFFDELQDLDSKFQARLRKPVERASATFIFACSNLGNIDDALRNRLQSYQYSLLRPTSDEVVDYLHQRFEKLGLMYESRQQLMRVASHYQCDMRSCSEFPNVFRAETEGVLTDEYLNEVFDVQLTISETDLPEI